MASSSFKISPSVDTSPKTVLEVRRLIINGINISTAPNFVEQSGILYSNNGVLVYRGGDGTITFLANS